jgi:hypothetical protein
LANLLIIQTYLEIMPQIRGSLSYGRLHDPALATVSPHLMHQNTIPAAYGAQFIETDMTDDMLSGALANSKTRRRLYEEGKYRPLLGGLSQRAGGWISRAIDCSELARHRVVAGSRELDRSKSLPNGSSRNTGRSRPGMRRFGAPAPSAARSRAAEPVSFTSPPDGLFPRSGGPG